MLSHKGLHLLDNMGAKAEESEHAFMLLKK